MDIEFSPEDRAFREEVRQWLEENKPRETRPVGWPDARTFDLAWQAKQYEGGWAGISWPKAYGGRGLSLIQQIIWFEEYAHAGCPGVGVNFVGVNHAGPTLIARASEEQKSYHLPKILKGEKVWCQGFSEPGAGSDLAGIRTRAHIEGDTLVVNGSKIWTSYAGQADFQELVLRTDPDAPRHSGLSWVICDMHAPGITIRPIRMINGQQDLNQVFYDDVRLPLANVVGELNNGWSVAMSTLSFERGTGFIADQVKLAEHVEQLIAQAREGVDARGRPLLANEAVAQSLMELRAEVTALRAMTYASVSRLVDGGQPDARASLVRLYSSELAQKVARLAVTFAGPEIAEFAYGEEGLMHDYLRGFANTIAGGSAQIQRNIIGERLLGLPRDR